MAAIAHGNVERSRNSKDLVGVIESLLLRIDGKDLAARDNGVFDINDPATGDQLYEVTHATTADVDTAVLANVMRDNDLWHEEVFGPVTLISAFDDEADAVTQANDSPFGLAASVWTRDVGRAVWVSERLDIGIVWVNDHHRIDPASQWGGFKDSGLGSENGLEAYRPYTHPQFATVDDVRDS